jgi:two-component system sensor histidine kinase and response regulator WspE
MSAAERVAHALEDVFVAAQRGAVRLGSMDVDALLASVDLLGDSSKLDEAGLPGWLASNESRIERTIINLRAIEAGTTTTAQVEAPSVPEPAPDPPPVAEEVPDSRARRKPRTRAKEKTPEAEAPPEIAEPVPAEPPLEVPPQVVTPDRAAQEISPRPLPRGATQEAGDRVVRVTAENLNRLMGLAGESLVEARRLRPLVDSLTGVKDALEELRKKLAKLDEMTDADPVQLRAVASETRLQLQQGLEALGDRHGRMEQHARRSEDLAERLHYEVIASRLRPMVDGTKGFPRLVRDVARQLGKQVRFEVLGEQTGVDRDILEKLEAPLTHLIRNALDHGIEEPPDREASGKPPEATIRLEARHVAGMLQITLSDDGKGVDAERIRAKVVDRGLATEGMAGSLSEPELLEFLFLPGFSTKDSVTDLSGRGVGLDVVQSMVQAVGGSVRISSQIGRGTTFSLQLPITMSVIRALLVRIGGEPYAFPLSRLDRILTVAAGEVEQVEGRRIIRLDEQSLGLVSAAQVLEVAGQGGADGSLQVVVISDRGHSFGVVVEEVLGERDLDVRPLDARLGKVPNLSSVSVLEDGWPVLILDVEDLVRSIDNLLHGRKALTLAEGVAANAAIRPARRVLVVDDSITVRELERQLLENRGYDVEVAIDGMDGWNTVRSSPYDLVVTDVDMPRMDGIQLVRQIKQDARLASIPVVIVSYKDRQEDRMRGLDAGADAYLTKSSFHDETFLRTVVDLIGEPVE